MVLIVSGLIIALDRPFLNQTGRTPRWNQINIRNEHGAITWTMLYTRKNIWIYQISRNKTSRQHVWSEGHKPWGWRFKVELIARQLVLSHDILVTVPLLDKVKNRYIHSILDI
jgi:hypothetical protein